MMEYYGDIMDMFKKDGVMKCRKKPAVSEVIQFNGNFEEIEKFVGGDAEFRAGELIVATLKGAMHVMPKDFIVKDATGEFYTCKPDAFYKTYDIINPIDYEKFYNIDPFHYEVKMPLTKERIDKVGFDIAKLRCESEDLMMRRPSLAGADFDHDENYGKLKRK